MPEDFTDQCYCCVSANADLQDRCVKKGHCIFLRSGLRRKAALPITTRVGALTDYFAGMTCDALSTKWGVSHGYVSNMLARAEISGRSKEEKAANMRLGHAKRKDEVKRKLIPYAGKE